MQPGRGERAVRGQWPHLQLRRKNFAHLHCATQLRLREALVDAQCITLDAVNK